MHKSKSFLEKKTNEILWDFEIQNLKIPENFIRLPNPGLI